MLKIHLVVGLGYIIGELKHDFKNKVIIKHAGIVHAVGKNKVIIGEPIMSWMANFMEQIKEFSISKHLIIAQDDVMPGSGLEQLHERYVKEFEAKEAGIHTPNEAETKKFGQKILDITGRTKG